MQRPTPHVQIARVVARAPIQELDVRLVTRAARSDRVEAVARDLPRTQSREPDVGRDDEEDHQLELRDQRIAPPAERSRQRPARRRRERVTKQWEARLT